MGYSKEQLLTRLKELAIEFELYEHPVVLTVEAGLKHLANVDGAFCKNLFLKDKKHRFYVISALSETKVDMKVLSQRLGLGKGGLKMAPVEALGEILQVPLGCVTPFALVNESARHVSLLLDHGLRSQNRILFHPLSDDMSVALSTVGVDKFLESIGRHPAYVDLEADPPVGKEQPPDLATFVPSDAIVIPETLGAPQQMAAQENQLANSGSTVIEGKAAKKPVEVKYVKKKSENVKDAESKSSKAVSFANPHRFVDDIIDLTSNLVLSEVGVEAFGNIQKRLRLELKNLAMIFKNSAYTEGFHAGTQCNSFRK